MTKSNIVLQKKEHLALYEIDFTLLVVLDVDKAAKELGAPLSDDLRCDGLTLSNKRTVVVIFEQGSIGHSIVAHELFHATHRALQLCSAAYSDDHQEPFAYLNGWLHAWAYGLLKKAGVRVR